MAAPRTRDLHEPTPGAAEQVADRIQEWFGAGAADGFNIMPPYLTGGLEDFVDQVVPILRERGLFRTQYEGRSLREHHCLPCPSSRFAEKKEAPRSPVEVG